MGAVWGGDGATSPRASGRRQHYGSASELASGGNSRLAEKRELGGLNDRLVAYIERVRQLEGENNKLTLYIRHVEEELKTSSRQVTQPQPQPRPTRIQGAVPSFVSANQSPVPSPS